MADDWEAFKPEASAEDPWKAFTPQPPAEPSFGPPQLPQPVKNRLLAGDVLRSEGLWGNVGGAMPEASVDWRKTFVGSQVQGAWNLFTLPHRVMSGETKLTTPEGMDEGV